MNPDAYDPIQIANSLGGNSAASDPQTASPIDIAKSLSTKTTSYDPTAASPMDIANSLSDKILPNPVPVTQTFGNYNPTVEKYSGGVNYGTDLGASAGTPVSLPHGKWQVVEAKTGSFNSGYGNSILVKDLATGYTLRFSHLSDMQQVQPGQELSGGLIGHTGATGNTTGPHLDIETHTPDGKMIDVLRSPYGKYIKVAGSGSGGEGGGGHSIKGYDKSAAGEFMKGFFGAPGEGVNSNKPLQSLGDSVANATPGGHEVSQLPHILPIAGTAAVGAGKTFMKAADELPKIKPFEGAVNYTTKVLDKLKGATSVSPQYINDLTRMPDVKQAEKDVIGKAMQNYNGQPKIPVNQFAKDVEGELLPLKRDTKSANGAGHTQYENVTLPSELRGNVANYYENIHSSPIPTSAGGVHFSQTEFPNYFAHTRVEDLADNVDLKSLQDATTPFDQFDPRLGRKAVEEAGGKPGGTRRVIELQSDLMQKGRLDAEKATSDLGRPLFNDATGTSIADATSLKPGDQISSGHREFEVIQPLDADMVRVKTPDGEQLDVNLLSGGSKNMRDAKLAENEKRNTDLAKLKPYENTWHERVIREEVKKAAQDGKTKLQFPTGETAMKIEGLGQGADTWITMNAQGLPERTMGQNLATGQTMYRGGQGHGQEDAWIITDVLGDGKFKAFPKRELELQVMNDPNYYSQAEDVGAVDPVGGEVDFDKVLKRTNILDDLKENSDMSEQFDISGKVDQNNPIYKFYASKIAKFLKNEFQGYPVTDEQGVTWNEMVVPKDYHKKPIKAFAATPLMALPAIYQNRQQQAQE